MICQEIVGFANSEFGSSLIGAAATIWAVRATIRHENEKQLSREVEETKAVCSAIKTEIIVCLEKYMEVGSDLEFIQDGQTFDVVYRVEEDYFTVFNGNSSQVGRISPLIREKILRAYIEMKSLLDTYRLNNENIESTNAQIHKLLEINLTNNVDMKIIKERIDDSIKTYQSVGIDLVDNLQNKHRKMRNAVDEALAVLKDF